MNIILKRICLSFFSILICLFILEIGIRIISKHKPDKVAKVFDRGEFLYQSSPERLHSWTQGVTNKLTIVVIGDSIANGAGVQPYDRFANRLEAYLNYSPDTLPTEVFLLAKGGLSTQQEYNSYMRLARNLHPNIIILAICLNDAEDWANKQIHQGWKKDRIPNPPPKWLAPILKLSKILSLIYIKSEYVKCQKATQKYYHNLYNDDYTGWQKMKSTLAAFKKTCDQDQIKFLVVMFPSVSVVDRIPYPYQFAYNKIEEVMNKNNIDYIDLLEIYKGKSSMRLQALPGLDAHPNEIAHNMAAVQIFETLMERDYISTKYVYSKKEPYSEEYWEYLFEKMRDPIGYFFKKKEENENE